MLFVFMLLHSGSAGGLCVIAIQAVIPLFYQADLPRSCQVNGSLHVYHTNKRENT